MGGWIRCQNRKGLDLLGFRVVTYQGRTEWSVSSNSSWAANVTIQDLGSIGELIAAVATILTLFYLALQIRASTKVARLEAVRSTSASSQTHSIAIAQDPALAELFLKGLGRYPDLEPVEATRFAFLMSSQFGALSAAYREVDLGFSSDADVDYVSTTINRLLRTPGGARWFEEYSGYYPKHFVDLVSRTLAADDAPLATPIGAAGRIAPAAQQGNEADAE